VAALIGSGLLSTNLFAAGCHNKLALGQEYLETGRDYYQAGQRLKDTADEKFKSGETESACELLKSSSEQLQTAEEYIYLATGEYSEAAEICTGAFKASAEAGVCHSQEIMTEAIYHIELVESDLFYLCK
jgi:hypothetical protein